MIAKVGRNLSKCIKINNRTVIKLSPLLQTTRTHQNSYYFSQSSREKILRELKEQMQYFRQNLPQQEAQNQDYFKNQGWQIIYDQPKTLYSFSKSTGKFDIKIFTQVKSNPPNLQTEELEEPEEEKQKGKKINYAQILVWIKKKQDSKWMVSQLGVIEGGVQLTTVYFTDFSPGIGWQKHVYSGPDITSLPKEVLQAINSVFQKASLKTQLLMNMVLYASRKSDQLDYKWMQDFKQVLS